VLLKLKHVVHASIKGKNVTGFFDTKEAGVKLTKVVPFLSEDEYIAIGNLTLSTWSRRKPERSQ